MHITYLVLASILFFPLISGCGGYHAKCYPGPELEKSQTSIITTDDQFVTIGGVDGERIKHTSSFLLFFNAMLWDGRYPRSVTVLPGNHRILPCYQGPYKAGCASHWLEIETKAEQSYIIKYNLGENKGYEFWIEPQRKSDRTVHQELLSL